MKPVKLLETAVFPSRCVLCDTVLTPGNTLCKDCSPLLINYKVQKHPCSVCGIDMQQCVCPPFLLYDAAVFPFYYRGATVGAMQRLKYKHRTDLVTPLCARLNHAINERCFQNMPELITFVPMRGLHRFIRGYNQSELLAKELSRLMGIPCLPLLRQEQKTKPQHSLKLLGRKGNVLGLYEPAPNAPEQIKNKRILVVDDIITSGATVNEIAKTLLIFGAEGISVASVAVTPKREHKKKGKYQ